MGLTLGVRLVFCFIIYPHLADRFADADGYDVIARNLAQGKGYMLDGTPAAAERLPVYPALLAASFLLFGPSFWPWQLAQSLCGAATCGLILNTAQRHSKRTGALGAAMFCALHPTLVLYTSRPLTETLYVLLVVLFFRALSQGTWSPRSVGMLWGVQLLTKSTAVLQSVAFVPAIRQRRWRKAGWAAIVGLVVLSPWVVWNLSVYGKPHVMERSGITWYHGLYISRHVGWTTPTGDLNAEAEVVLWQDLARRGVARDADVVRRDAIAGEVAWTWVASHPGEMVRLCARNLVLTWYLGRSRGSMLLYLVLHGTLLAAATLGAVRLWSRQPASRDLVIIAVLLIAGYTAFHAVVQPAVRYILPVVPLAAVLAAGVAGKADRERTGSPRPGP